MFTVTQEQEYILSILHKTKVMRKEQAVKLLRIADFKRNAEYTTRCLEQLRHIRKIKWVSSDVFTLPILYMEPIDEEMLSAVDIMLDLTDSKILALSASKPPYKLCFVNGSEDSFGSYAVIVVPHGSETMITASLYGAESNNRTVIFLLSDSSQKERIKTALPHFFAIHDSGKYRYFKGGG